MNFGLENEISDVTSEPKFIDFPHNQITSQNKHHIVSGGPQVISTSLNLNTLNIGTMHSKTGSDDIIRSPIPMPISTGQSNEIEEQKRTRLTSPDKEGLEDSPDVATKASRRVTHPDSSNCTTAQEFSLRNSVAHFKQGVNQGL